jgi:methionyl-tRNA formyltransferase
VRGTNPKPGAWTIFNSASLKILKTQCISKDVQLGSGQYLITDDSFLVGTGYGVISLLKIQEEGKPALAISDFLRGYRHAREGHFT